MLPEKFRKSEALFPGFEDIFWPNGDEKYYKPSEIELKTFPIDVKEYDDRYEVKADVAGLEKEDISIYLNDNDLTISCKHNEEKSYKDDDGVVIKAERFTSSATRHIYFEKEINENKIQCKLKNGVLNISAPKMKEDKNKSKKIDIE